MALTNLPKVVDLVCYAGDTLSFTVTAPAAVVEGLTWKAQVRKSSTATGVDATFLVVPPTVSGGPAQVTLTAADTARLGSYYGAWDIQVASPDGGDPVHTLVQGEFAVERDVSR
jgi:hypothetical protein